MKRPISLPLSCAGAGSQVAWTSRTYVPSILGTTTGMTNEGGDPAFVGITISPSPPLQTASPPRTGFSSAMQHNVTSVGSGESTLNATVTGIFEPGATTPSMGESVDPKELSAEAFGAG